MRPEEKLVKNGRRFANLGGGDGEQRRGGDRPDDGTRMLGIPTVEDRLIQQMLLQALTPIFDPMFSEHSYGFRPGRKAQDAVQAAQKFAQEGKGWVVDPIRPGDPGQTGMGADWESTCEGESWWPIVSAAGQQLSGMEERLRWKVNEAKSGTGRIWGRKFLSFRWNRKPQIGIALPSGRRPAADLQAGRLDTSAHPEAVLVAVA